MKHEFARREFLKKTVGCGLAGLSVRSSPLTAPAQFSGLQRVELAVATITCDGFGDENFEKAFSLIPRLPFRNVEFNCWYARNLMPAGIRSIEDRCRENNLRPVCIQGSSFGASGNIIKDVAHKLWNMEAAKKLGCKRVKFTGAGRGTEGGLDAVIKVLKELAPAAEEMDQLILVENHADNNLERIEDYDKVFSAVPSSHVGMCMDNAHFDGANVPLLDVVERFHSRILHIDIKETVRKGIHKIVPFGEGVTDNRAVIERMLAHGYSGYLLIEMTLNEASQDVREQELRKAYHLFKEYER